METIIHLIEKDGLNVVIIGLVLYLVFKYANKNIDRKPCIYSKEFMELKRTVDEIKSLFQGFLLGFKYRGKDDE